MITIDARIDNHPDYKPGESAGAVFKYLETMDKYLWVKEVIDRKGNDVTESIRQLAWHVGKRQGIKVSVKKVDDRFLIVHLGNQAKEVRRNQYVKIAYISALKDNHRYFQPGSMRGAIAKYVLRLKEGEEIEIREAIDSHDREIDFKKIRTHVGHIATMCRCKLSCRINPGVLVVKMEKKDTEFKKPVKYKRREKVEPPKPVTPKETSINAFLMGRTSYEQQRTA